MADNAVTRVLNKGPRVKANSRFSKLFDQGKLFHLRLGFGDNRKNYYGTKLELDNIFKNIPAPFICPTPKTKPLLQGNKSLQAITIRVELFYLSCFNPSLVWNNASCFLSTTADL